MHTNSYPTLIFYEEEEDNGQKIVVNKITQKIVWKEKSNSFYYILIVGLCW